MYLEESKCTSNATECTAASLSSFPLKISTGKTCKASKASSAQKRIGIFSKGVGTTPIEIVQRIEEYSRLELTNPSDILKGMLGIFSAFQRSPLRIHHCAGIPILPSMPTKDFGKPIAGWTRSMGFFTGLFWTSEKQSERRNAFPSWSWTGWYGPGKWGEHCWYWPSIKVDADVGVNVKLVDGRTLSLETFLDSYSSLSTQLTNTIHITTWTIEIKVLEYNKGMDKDASVAKLNLENGGYLKWNFKHDSKVKLIPGQLCKGLIVGHSYGPIPPVMRPMTGPTVLVLGKVGDTMERVGLGWIEEWAYDRYDKDGVRESEPRSPCSMSPDSDDMEAVHLWEGAYRDLIKSWEQVQLS